MNQMLQLYEGNEGREEERKWKKNQLFRRCHILATTFTIYDRCVYAVCIGYKCVVHIVSGLKYNIRHTDVGNVWCESFFFTAFANLSIRNAILMFFYTHGIKTAIQLIFSGPAYIQAFYRWKYKIYRHITITTKFHTISHTQYTYILFTIEIIWLLVVMFTLSFVLRFVSFRFVEIYKR